MRGGGGGVPGSRGSELSHRQLSDGMLAQVMDLGQKCIRLPGMRVAGFERVYTPARYEV